MFFRRYEVFFRRYEVFFRRYEATIHHYEDVFHHSEDIFRPRKTASMLCEDASVWRKHPAENRGDSTMRRRETSIRRNKYLRQENIAYAWLIGFAVETRKSQNNFPDSNYRCERI